MPFILIERPHSGNEQVYYSIIDVSHLLNRCMNESGNYENLAHHAPCGEHDVHRGEPLSFDRMRWRGKEHARGRSSKLLRCLGR